MARRGTFGRQPRSAPSLTATLISIAREQQNERDRNIVDAWQKGGLFEGKPATDEVLLDHWKHRLDGISKDDPMYDTYQNAYVQADYSIHESKQSVLYSQGKINDAQMASFYLTWAKKVPVNSEFYRVLQRDAAQFMQASKNRGRANTGKAKEDAYNRQQDGLHKKNEAAGEFMVDTLRAMAQRGDADTGIVGLIAGPGSGSDLTDFDATDPEQMLRLLNEITPSDGSGRPGDSTFTPTNRVLYHDSITGEPVTGASIAEKMKSLDPRFNGTLDLNYVKGLISTQLDGIQQRIDLATKTGHISDANALRKSQEYVATVGRQVNAWPVEQDYMHLRSAALSVMSDSSALPQAKLDAWRTYQAGLMTLSEDPRIAADDRMRSALVGEANGTDGTVTMGESFTQAINSQGQSGDGEVFKTKIILDSLQQQVDRIRSDPNALWTTGFYDAQGVFVAKPGGPAIGASDQETVKNLAGTGGDPQHIFVPTANGAPTPVVVVDAPVYATAKNADGGPMNTDNSNPVASVYIVTIGGQQMKVYGFRAADGTKMYSADPPWDQSRITAKQTTKGITLDLTKIAAPGAPGFTIRGATAGGRNIQPKAGELYLDPNVAVKSSDPSRAAAGFDPTTDFYSPTIAALMSTPDGQQTLAGLQKDPLFRRQMEAEAYNSAGYNNVEGQWVPGPNANAAKLQQNQLQNAYVDGALTKGIDNALKQGVALWNKFTTSPAYDGALPAGKAQDDLAFGGKLPSDALVGTDLAPMGDLWHAGTNVLKTGQPDATQGTAIKMGTALTLPTYSSPKVEPKPITTSTTTTVGGTPGSTVKPYAAPTGSTAPTGGIKTYVPPSGTGLKYG